MRILLLLMVVVVVQGEVEEAPVVKTEGGLVKGVVERTVKDAPFWSYRAIPFAQPPVGSLRFKPPVDSLGWEGVRDGAKDPEMCIQASHFDWTGTLPKTMGSEDCLYLNVFTPVGAKDRTIKLPVMVFIHGGAFFGGSASMYGPAILLDQDIIMVVLQYRVGVMGFLSTEDDVLPGNMGMLDQVAGLRWVQDNIHHFGGDASAVTIVGGSAGGASVSYHLLSPLTKGLFSRAIAQSGSSLNPWARGGSFKQVAERIGRDLCCPDTTHSPTLLTCLQKASANDLAAYTSDIRMFGIDPVLMAPRVDGVYLAEEPAVLLRDGRHHHVPLITGITAHEGALNTAQMFANASMAQLLTKREVQEVSLELQDEADPFTLASRIFSHYLGGRHFGEDRLDELTEMYGDRLFNVGVEEMARRYSRMAPTFTYEFTQNRPNSPTSLFFMGSTPPPRQWVCHGDDHYYLFPLSAVLNLSIATTPNDERMRDLMTRLWVNFASTGNPTPDDSLGFTWTPFDPSDPHHLDLNLTPAMAPDRLQKVLDFWSSLPLKENLLMAPEKVVFEEGHKEEL